eukprot:gnl/TRDRNA2_/TRDRNA2_70381_c0_seq1.p1 gnl/TRDRNA2_/TRDRNA2_70381_c0~~gnl/TRDRNA2_/TRDRNA2_70381_c0_seq1.p1  ORF type:complete len:118 (+),score=10.46 gnl/TRDRNA2_/TRDRNA2_70381_c0_seq1:704-1057(+)
MRKEKPYAVRELSKIYTQILSQFAEATEGTDTSRLRLIPVCGGIGAGDFKQEIASMTAEALQRGFEELNPVQKTKVMAAQDISMYIWKESCYEPYQDGFRDTMNGLLSRKHRYSGRR